MCKFCEICICDFTTNTFEMILPSDRARRNHTRPRLSNHVAVGGLPEF